MTPVHSLSRREMLCRAGAGLGTIGLAYKGRYGSAWTGDGKIGAATSPADEKLSSREGVK